MMKKCPYCGLENPDDALICRTCHTELVTPPASQPEPVREYLMSPEERSFWERMTFRQFAIVMIRLQAVWLLFTATVHVVDLARYFPTSGAFSLQARLTPAGKLELFLLVLRIAIYVAAAVAVIQYAERLLGWLVKDYIQKPPPKQNE